MSVQPGPNVPVTVLASEGIPVRFRRLMTMVEFAPGLRFRLTPGLNQFRVPPGRYSVRFWSPYAWMSVGVAQLTVDLRPGTEVTLNFSTPLSIYGQGSAGFGPLPYRPATQGHQWVIMAVAAAIILIFICVAVGIAWYT